MGVTGSWLNITRRGCTKRGMKSSADCAPLVPAHSLIGVHPRPSSEMALNPHGEAHR
jgi:hypothetical protein